jgi:phosphoribosyl-ATP pyrophosphohydrolase
MASGTFSLNDLARLVAERASAGPGQSYTAKLLAGGPALAAKKLGEEAIEVAIAAVQGDRKALVAEAADVLYHLVVVLQAGNVPLDDVMAELERRTAQSGLAEKESRKEAPVRES